MASATPGLGPHVECENIIIRRRRKRLQPPEPWSVDSVTVEPCTGAPLDFVLSDEARPNDLPPADGEGIQEACPLPGDVLIPQESTGESGQIRSDFGSHSESALPSSNPDPDHRGQPITVHEFLQDMTRSGKAGRKYGRRKRLGTVQLDHSEQCRTSPTTPSTSNCHIETQTRNSSNDHDDRRISAYPRGRVQSERHLSHQVSHLRRKKRFAKSLAQRLFEADVFSSGASPSSHSTGVTPDQNSAHTSSRRPLQFITSLNLTPSMESRIYGKKQHPRSGKARTTSASSGSADSEIQPVSQADDSVLDSLQDDRLAVKTTGGKLTTRNWNGAATRKKRTRARASTTAVMRGSGKRAFRTPRHGGGKRSSAQVPHNPFEYVPLPLVRVETASRIQRTGVTVRKPQSCTVQAGAGHARKAHARILNQFQLMSADNHASGPRAKEFQ